MTTSPLVDALRRVGAGNDLSAAETEAVFGEVLEGRAPEAILAALLAALHVKGETAEELAGAVTAVRARVDRHGLRPVDGAIDTCGTGGDGANTLNVSTATALVVAACGVPVVKHGNRSASGNSGSAEVLAELGVSIEPEPAVLARGLAELGLTFLFAPRFHPGLRHAAPVRRQLPFRTIFNLVGPLANPLDPPYQLVGVSGERPARLMAEALARLGVRRAAVVTGADGLDEVSLAGPTRVLLVTHGHVDARVWEPAQFGLGAVDVQTLRVSGPAESADRIERLLRGEPGACRAIVLANAAAALQVAGACGDDLREGVRLAAEAIDLGRAADLLDRWRVLGTPQRDRQGVGLSQPR